MSERSAKSDGDDVKQTIVESLEAPRLRNIDVKDFVTFKERREKYERKVAEKNADRTVKVQLTSYRSSVDDSVLFLFILADWVEAKTVDEITEEQIKKCVEEQAKVEEQDYNLGDIEHDIRGVRLNKTKRGFKLEKQVLKLCLHYTDTLRKCGYDQFIAKRPKHAVKHILKRLTHPQLATRVNMIWDLRKDEFEDDFHKFVRLVREEARAIDLQEAAQRYRDGKSSSSDSEEENFSAERKRKSKSRRQKKSRSAFRAKKTGEHVSPISKDDSRPSEGRNKRKFKLPDCLNPNCSEQHFIKDCANTSEPEKKRLREEYRSSKRQKSTAAGKLSVIGSTSSHNVETCEENSSLFSATFYDGAVEAMCMADQGSDANIIPPRLLQHLCEADKSLSVTKLRESRTFGTASKKAEPIKCSRVVIATVRLRVRHGTSLSLANIKWFVADDDEIDNIFIGRHVLAAIGLDNRKLLAIASDQNAGYIDVDEAMQQSGKPNEACAGAPAGSICSILQCRDGAGLTSHSIGDKTSDGLDEADVYVDLGEDIPEELDAALAGQLAQAKANGLSESGTKRLEELFKTFRSVFGCGWEKPHQPL